MLHVLIRGRLYHVTRVNKREAAECCVVNKREAVPYYTY
jgi:hypothetical protein